MKKGCLNHNPFLKRQYRSRSGQRGVALITALFVLFFLLTLATTYVFTVQLEINLARNYEDDMKAQYIARAGIYRALGELRTQTRSGTFSYPRPDREEDAELFDRYQEVYNNVPVGGGRYTVKFKDNFGQVGLGPMDESSLININALAQSQNRELLSRLFDQSIDDLATVDKVLDCLIDYIDKDDFASVNGAEQMEYDDLDPPATIANGPMKNIHEFLTVLEVMKNLYPDEIDDTIWFGEDSNGNGILDPNEDDGFDSPPFDDMDGILDRGIKDFVTVDSGTDKINPNTASPQVLEIMMPDQYEQLIEERQFGPVSGNSSVFRIRSYGKYKGYTHVVEWVVTVGRGSYPSVIRMYSL
jgi:type II secretory pathway component PulK